ncbi:MAG: hypothetical protein KBD56_04645 [Candidatus Eisenbacteria bacterium]|nr:hypothetical protein [Candidatus Eisenbacteria bacterium]
MVFHRMRWAQRDGARGAQAQPVRGAALHAALRAARVAPVTMAWARVAFALFACAMVAFPSAFAQETGSWSGWARLRTTAYRFESIDADDIESDRLGAYQEFDAAVRQMSGPHLAFRFAARLADDLYLKDRVQERGRLFVGQVEARPIERTTARFGRQFVQEGAAGLTLDGLWLNARPSARWDLRAWGGARAPLSRAFRTGSLGDEPAWGMRALATVSPRVRVGGSWAYRERDGRVAARLAGLEAAVQAPYGVRLALRGAYDFERDLASRADLLAQWQPSRSGLGRWPALTLQLVHRHPAIDAVSYFARFDSEPRNLVRAAARHDFRWHDLGAEIEYFGSFAEDRDGHRLGGALLFKYGRIGYAARLGDIGEESDFFGDVSYEFASWGRVEAGASFVTYVLLEDALERDERDLTTAYGRALVRPRAGVGLVLEVQSLTNPFLDEDIRVLAGLDLTAGVGAGRFGLSQGGW